MPSEGGSGSAQKETNKFVSYKYAACIAVVLFACILGGCQNTTGSKPAAPIENPGNHSSEDSPVTEPSSGSEGSTFSTERYSCTVGGKTVSFDAPAGFHPQEPMEAYLVSNLIFYNLSVGSGASGMIDVIVTAPEYEQSLSTPTERTAEEYLTSLANRPDDFVGDEQAGTEAYDVTFGDYSGYYETYLHYEYARQGRHHLSQCYSLFSGDSRIQISYTLSNTTEGIKDTPYISNIEIHDE